MSLITAGRLGATLATLTVLLGCAADPSQAVTAADGVTPPKASSSQFRSLEKTFDARLGVYALDTGTGRSVSFQADQRFAYASTSKALQAGVLLRQRTDEQLAKVVHYDESDLLEYAPITSEHVDTGMSLRDLLDASLRYSDNTAANLLFEELGGPRRVDAALARIVGDHTTHMDRTEPDLNTAVPGDVRDTSTPRAMATDLRAFVLGKALNPGDQATLTDLMKRNTTGDDLIRAGVPDRWVVGDKTGSGSYGTRNDIAVVWPSHGAPIVIAVMSTRDTVDASYDNALIAQATKVVVDQLT